MAKKTAAQIDTEQSTIPEQHRANMRVSEDTQSVVVSFTLPRVIAVLIRKHNVIEIDTTMIAGASRLLSVFLYGLGRKMRDCGSPKESYKDKNGDVVERVFTTAEKLEYAMAHAEMRREWLYGEREQQSRGGISVETQECRYAVVGYLCNTLGYTKSSVPSEIAKALTVEDLQHAAKQNGVPAKAVQALIKRGRAIAEMRSEDIEIDLD